jgi:hypothetical protein
MGFIVKHIPYVIGSAFIVPSVTLLIAISSSIRVKASPPVAIEVQITAAPSPTLTNTPTAYPTKKPTPQPTPSPTPYPVTSEQLEEWFTKYSNHYSIERKKLWLMAVCESGLRPNAKNGIYGGLYQFSGNAWHATRIQMNADPDPTLRFNPEEAIKTAAFKISTSGLSAWPNCSKAN